MTCDVRTYGDRCVDLEQRIQCTGPNDSEWVVRIRRRSRHAAGVHQTVLVLSTLIEHHLTRAVKT